MKILDKTFNPLEKQGNTTELLVSDYKTVYKLTEHLHRVEFLEQQYNDMLFLKNDIFYNSEIKVPVIENSLEQYVFDDKLWFGYALEYVRERPTDLNYHSQLNYATLKFSFRDSNTPDYKTYSDYIKDVVMKQRKYFKECFGDLNNLISFVENEHGDYLNKQKSLQKAPNEIAF